MLGSIPRLVLRYCSTKVTIKSSITANGTPVSALMSVIFTFATVQVYTACTEFCQNFTKLVPLQYHNAGHCKGFHNATLTNLLYSSLQFSHRKAKYAKKGNLVLFHKIVHMVPKYGTNNPEHLEGSTTSDVMWQNFNIRPCNLYSRRGGILHDFVKWHISPKIVKNPKASLPHSICRNASSLQAS